jgi:hypothetical protein
MRIASSLVLLSLVCLSVSCAKKTQTAAVDPNVTTRGSIEVTAQLEEIRGDLIDDPMYDYAHVMKYKVLQVHRGKVDKDVIDDHYMGGIINKYFGEVNDPVYWAIWTDKGAK